MAEDLSDLVPREKGAFEAYLREQFEQLSAVPTRLNASSVKLRVLHAAPIRPRQGVIVYADGTDWNPGSGEGVYRHNGTSWVFLG